MVFKKGKGEKRESDAWTKGSRRAKEKEEGGEGCG